MLIIGLGNPGEKFKNTRHNTGFLFLDYLKDNLYPDEEWKLEKDCDSYVILARGKAPRPESVLAKPQTFMNDSGEAVAKLLKKYNSTSYVAAGHAQPIFSTFKNQLATHASQLQKDAVSNTPGVCIVHDDLDLPLGEFRIQKGRGAAGHHGVESIIEKLGTKDFWRVRIGTSGPLRTKINDDAKFVLQNFTKDEKTTLQGVFAFIYSALMGQHTS